MSMVMDNIVTVKTSKNFYYYQCEVTDGRSPVEGPYVHEFSPRSKNVRRDLGAASGHPARTAVGSVTFVGVGRLWCSERRVSV